MPNPTCGHVVCVCPTCYSPISTLSMSKYMLFVGTCICQSKGCRAKFRMHDIDPHKLGCYLLKICCLGCLVFDPEHITNDFFLFFCGFMFHNYECSMFNFLRQEFLGSPCFLPRHELMPRTLIEVFILFDVLKFYSIFFFFFK